jgi:hypothetical protein
MAGGIMRYVKVSGQDADNARDLVVLALVDAGVTRSNFDFDRVERVLSGRANGAVLFKSFLRHQKYVFNKIAEI